MRTNSFFVIALGCTIGLHAQQSSSASQSGSSGQESRPRLSLIPRSHDQRETAYQAQHRIILNAQVTDADGKPASGLKPEDFTVLDDLKPQPLVSFRAAQSRSQNDRAHVLIVFDTVNNSSRVLGVERRELERFLDRHRGRLIHLISIVVLSRGGAVSGHASRDADVLLAQLRDIGENMHPMDCGSEGGIKVAHPGSETYGSGLDLGTHESVKDRQTKAECLNERFVVSVSALNKLARQQTDVPGRAIMIWLGEGWPLLLGAEFKQETQAESRNHFDFLAELSASLREGQVTLNSVSSPDLFHKEEPGAEKLSSVAAPGEDQASTADFALPRLVRQTGGQVLQYSKDLAGEIEASIADAESYYVLAFDSPPVAGVGEYRTLDVKVNRPGFKVRTNTAYFAQP